MGNSQDPRGIDLSCSSNYGQYQLHKNMKWSHSWGFCFDTYWSNR